MPTRTEKEANDPGAQVSKHPHTRGFQLVLKMQKCCHGGNHDDIQELKAVLSIHPKYISIHAQ